MEGYIARHLSASVRNGHIPQEKYRVKEFVNELYLLAYEHVSEIEDEKDFPFWLFQKADEQLQKTIVEEEYNTRFLDNFERYTKIEWNQMQEDYCTDGEGELTLLEEFDDPAYPKYEYRLADVLVEDLQEEWIEKLNGEFGAGDVHEHIDMVMHRLPAPMKSIFDLAVNQKFLPREIANIKGLSVEKVQSYLDGARKVVLNSIQSRYGKREV